MALPGIPGSAFCILHSTFYIFCIPPGCAPFVSESLRQRCGRADGALTTPRRGSPSLLYLQGILTTLCGSCAMTPKTAVDLAAKKRKELKIKVLCQVRPHSSNHLLGEDTICHNSFSLRSLRSFAAMDCFFQDEALFDFGAWKSDVGCPVVQFVRWERFSIFPVVP